jgi:hypothetical protein
LTPAVFASSSQVLAGAPVAPLVMPQAPPAWHGAGADAPTRADTIQLHQRALEGRLRALDRQFITGLGRGAPATASSALARASLPAALRVGDLVPIRVPKFVDQCNQYAPITAVVRRITSRSIWLEDVANPPGGYAAGDIQTLNDFFDGSVIDTDINYFGALGDLDHNGRVAFVITQEVNRLSAAYDPIFGLAAFVKPVNNVPRATCPSSNEGEIVYLRTPDPSGGQGAPTGSPAGELRVIPLLLAHEFVHVIQFGHTIPGNPYGAAFKTNWLLEGQATLAEEIVGHRLSGRTVGRNYGFSVAYNEPEVTPVDWYRAFYGLSYYFGFDSETSRVPGAPEQCSWVGLAFEGNNGPCISNDVVAYDLSWSFLRFLSDRYGPLLPNGEPQLQRALLDSPVGGFAGVAAVTGTSMDALLALWSAALYVDDRIPGAAPALTFSSWNLFDIESHKFPTGHLVPRDRGFGTFTDQVSVRAGSTAYFKVSGAGRAATAIRLRDVAGGDLPAWMRVWIVRLQ